VARDISSEDQGALRNRHSDEGVSGIPTSAMNPTSVSEDIKHDKIGGKSGPFRRYK